jgi:hypothetical protein
VEARLEDPPADDEGPQERGGTDDAAHLRERRRPLRDRRVEGRRARASRLVPEPEEGPERRAAGDRRRVPCASRTAEGEERERLWQLVNQQWPDYDSYQTKTDREIPVVVLERASG